MTPPLHPFDPESPATGWTPEAFGLDPLPVFEAAPVGNHLNLATCSLLYRFFDADRVPLYYGVTTNPTHRWRTHQHKQWWPLARFVSLEPVPPAERLRRERKAIEAENPRFNVAGSRRPARVSMRLDSGPAIVAAQLRLHMHPDAFAALVAHLKAEPDSPTGAAS